MPGGLFPESFGLLMYYLRPLSTALLKFYFVFVYFEDINAIQGIPFV